MLRSDLQEVTGGFGLSFVDGAALDLAVEQEGAGFGLDLHDFGSQDLDGGVQASAFVFEVPVGGVDSGSEEFGDEGFGEERVVLSGQLVEGLLLEGAAQQFDGCLEQQVVGWRDEVQAEFLGEHQAEGVGAIETDLLVFKVGWVPVSNGSSEGAKRPNGRWRPTESRDAR